MTDAEGKRQALLLGRAIRELLKAAMPDKRCPSCKKVRPAVEFGLMAQGYLAAYCNGCMADRQAARREANREKYRVEKREWASKNAEYVQLIERDRPMTAGRKAAIDRAHRRRVDSLCDSYVKQQLGMDGAPEMLIKAKRVQLRLKRATRSVG